MESPYRTAEEVAPYIRRSLRSVHELTRTNQIPHRRFGRRCLFTFDEIDAWLAGGELETIRPRGGGRIVRVRKAA